MATYDGTIRPAPRLLRVRGIYFDGNPAPSVVRWAHGGYSAPWYGVRAYINFFYNGAEASADLTNPISDLCPFEDGSGNAALVIARGSAGYLGRHDGSSATWGTGATHAKVGLLTLAGPDLYGTCDLGVYSTAKLSKCIAGTDPILVASWSDGEPVGSPVYPINSLRAVGNAPVAGKPEGLYSWSPVDAQYINRLKSLERAPDVDNCKGMFEADYGLFVPTADGSLFLWDGFDLRNVSPRDYVATHSRNAPHLRSRITAGCAVGKRVFVATEPCAAGWTQEFSLYVQKCVTGTPDTYTDLTTNTTDGDLSTTGDVGALGNGQTDYLYVGASVPFEAVRFVVDTANTATERWSPPEYYSSGGSWTQFAATTGDTTVVANESLAQTGYIKWRDFYTAHSSMTSSAVNSVTRYWARFPVGTTGFSDGGASPTAVAEIYILPSRPPVSSDAGLAYTGPDAAGATSHILMGQWESSTLVWHDLFSVPVEGPIEAMAWVDTDTGQAEENAGPRLLMVTQFERWFAMMGESDMPGSPVNENYADGNQVGTPIIYFLPNELSDDQRERATVRKRAQAYDVYGEYVDGSDTLSLFQRWDHEEWDKLTPASTIPVEIEAPDVDGLRLECALAYEDPDVELAGPSISRVELEFEETDLRFDHKVQADAATPEVE